MLDIVTHWGQSNLPGEFHAIEDYLMRSCLKKTKRIRKNNIIFSPVIKTRKMCLYYMCACVRVGVGMVTVHLVPWDSVSYRPGVHWLRPGSPGSHQPLRPRCWDWKQEPLEQLSSWLWCLRGPLLPAPSPSPCVLSPSSITCFFYLRCFRLRKHVVYRSKKPRVRTGRTAFKTRTYFRDEKVFKNTAQAAPGPSSGFSPNIELPKLELNILAFLKKNK